MCVNCDYPGLLEMSGLETTENRLRVLEAIGRHCASTAVMVSAHQSIGCKALMLFGS